MSKTPPVARISTTETAVDQIDALIEAGILDEEDKNCLDCKRFAKNEKQEASNLDDEIIDTKNDSKLASHGAVDAPPLRRAAASSLLTERRGSASSLPGAFRMRGSEMLLGDISSFGISERGSDESENDSPPPLLILAAGETKLSCATHGEEDEDQLQVALPLRKEKSSPANRTDQPNKNHRLYICVAFGVLILTIVVSLGLRLSLKKKDSNSNKKNPPQTISPSLSPASLSPSSQKVIDRGDLRLREWMDQTGNYQLTLLALSFMMNDNPAGHVIREYDNITFLLIEDVDLKNGQIQLTKYLQPEWNAHIQSIMNRHMIQEELFGGDIQNGTEVRTFTGLSKMQFTKNESGSIELEGVPIIETDQYIGVSGVIHRVESLILPPYFHATVEQVMRTKCSKFYDSLDEEALRLLRSPSPLTVFCPIDNIFAGGMYDSNATLRHFVPRVNYGFAYSISGKVPKEMIDERVFMESRPGEYQRWTEVFQTALVGSTITMEVEAGPQFFPSGREISGHVLEPDLICSDGVLHVINAQILPE